MADLKPGQIRVNIKGGSSYICPEGNKANVIRCVSDVERVDHYKAPPPPPPPKPAVPERSKATLLGGLLKDNKILLPELIEWIEKSKSLEDLALVMKGESRAGAKTAYKERISELLN